MYQAFVIFFLLTVNFFPKNEAAGAIPPDVT